MKTLIVDAVCGVGFPTLMVALEAERVGMAHYVGDLHDYSAPGKHRWNRSKLEAMSLDQLQRLYEGLREAREDESVDNEPEWARNMMTEVAHAS